jgi:hypothetical protein
MAKCLPASGILLIGVGEGHIGPLLHVIQRAITSRGALDERAAEGGIHEAEWFATATISSRGKCVLPGSTKEIESNHAEVQDRLGSRLVGIKRKTGRQGAEDGDVDGPDSGGGRVGVSPCLEEGL